MSSFNIGDKVEVINKGASYTSYPRMADWVGLKNYQINECPEYKKIFVVIGMNVHEHSSDIVVGIINNNKGYLIGERGLKLVTKSKFIEGDLIEIDGKQLVMDYKINFNEEKAKLIARKQLI